jgi:hypothetical protein
MRLTGLRPENPVAMMAAYGTLRLLPGARLRWANTHPELDWDGDILAALAQQLPQRLEAPEINLLDDPRDKHIGGVAGYRALAETIPHEWLMAYAGETAGGIVSTDLELFGGQHKFVVLARKHMQALTKVKLLDKIEEALLGPWRYADAAQAWGWDAAMRLDAATLPLEASSAHKPGVLGAYWLAWESLPLWPMINGRTLGFVHAKGEGWYWQYPTCGEWLSWAGLKALVWGLPRLAATEQQALRVRVWTAPVLATSQFGKELGLARIWSSGQGPGGSRRQQTPDKLAIEP